MQGQTGHVLEKDSMLIRRAAVGGKMRAHALGRSRVLAHADEPLLPCIEALRFIAAMALALRCRVQIMPCAVTVV